MYIGLSGKAGAGKTTVSNILSEIHGKERTFIVPLASELKRIARDEFGWDGEKNDEGRKLLQLLGTECGRGYGGENFWVNKWNEKTDPFNKEDNLIICDDIRFDNEVMNIISSPRNGHSVEVYGRSFDLGNNSNHPSENGISENLIYHFINNDCDMETLRERVEKLYYHIMPEKRI